MTVFTTRVVLYGNANLSDYLKLATAMSRQGFIDIVVGSVDGISYRMPPGEYTTTSALTLTQIHDKAKVAAESVWTDCAVFVTQSAGVMFSRLKTIQ